ncbi:MAG TPA: hypothetical protein PKL21_09715, partial [Anaerolineaceae bacterium]|nr:hypothetical protein [Anaerolineaceae bacterium]
GAAHPVRRAGLCCCNLSLQDAAVAIPVFVGVGLVPTLICHCMAAWQSLYFVGARLNSPRHDPKGSASPLHPGMQRGILPLRADHGVLRQPQSPAA